MNKKGMKPSRRFSRAVAKISRTIRSDSPTHMFKISGPLTCMKYSFICAPVFSPSCLVRLYAVPADERLATTRRAVEKKSFRRGVLEFFEKIDMQQRKLDRVLDRLERFLLAADFFPR